MKCSEAMKLMPGAALGDLDAEPGRELDAHVAECPPCRAERAALSAAVSGLRRVDAVAGSTERRDAAVKAMRVAGAPQTRVRPPFVRRLSAAAAALFLAGAAFWMLRPSSDLTLRVVDVRGRADGYEARSGRCFELAPGTVVRTGDRVVTQSGSLVRFEVEGGFLRVGPDSLFSVSSQRRIMLDAGWVEAEFPRPLARGVVFSDPASNRVEMKSGRAEMGLRDVVSFVGSEIAFRIPRDPGAPVKFEDIPFWQACLEIVRSTHRLVMPYDEEVGRRKVSFYGRRTGNDDLFEDFLNAMELQGIRIEDGRGRASTSAPKADVVRHLRARVIEGEVLLEGSFQQRLRATAGQEGWFDAGRGPKAEPAGTRN